MLLLSKFHHLFRFLKTFTYLSSVLHDLTQNDRIELLCIFSLLLSVMASLTFLAFNNLASFEEPWSDSL